VKANGNAVLRYTTVVRGDSVRDRYAKGLALLGLGMLAGAGAIVDYWPAGGSLPLVPPVSREPLMAAATPGFADPFAIVVPAPDPLPAAPRVASVPTLRVTQHTSVAGRPVTLDAPRRSPVPEVSAAGAFPAESLVLLASAERAPVIADDAASSLAEPAEVSSPRSGAPLTADGEEDGFLTDAVKRTGASIFKTSAKAGLSVFDAVRSLGGAMKRALPN
jgi:hypothetical protein